ncbi:MAG: DUF72 domain-containing protein [Candidatus Bathyarchaeota archaeon]|nr:DUF72 domain-containing protein [Candidatus Bathyarchaeota archaeon]
MEIYVGTSGWMYDWNMGRSLDWYIQNSGLNAVELNASFYRFPSLNAIKSWRDKGGALRWTVKANRLITHVFKFNDKAFKFWLRFMGLFETMDHLIDFYLFQIPPSIKASHAQKIERFFAKTDIGRRFALEVRDLSWFNESTVKWASNLGVTLVSVDSPDFPRDIFNANNIVYLRMHGRTFWYSHNYSDDELTDVKERILSASPEKVYIFFNNNTNMLQNAQQMLKKFSLHLD